MLRLASEIQVDSVVNGPGLRSVLWLQGCVHNCKNCHNPETHDINGGFLVPCETIIEKLSKTKLQQGLTISGGEPFLQVNELIPLVQEVKKLGFDVWIYSGFTFKELLCKEENIRLLKLCDVLVDGKFNEDLKDLSLKFRGSKNQNIIYLNENYKKVE